MCREVVFMTGVFNYVPFVPFVFLVHAFRSHFRSEDFGLDLDPTCYVLFAFVFRTNFVPLLAKYLYPLLL